MYGKLSFKKNPDGTDALVISYSKNQGEFALDFLSSCRDINGYGTVRQYMEQFAGDRQIKNMQIEIDGRVVTSMPIKYMIQ